MPTPITHIVLTEEIFEKYFSDKNKKNFYIGTCFPDIRRIANLKRSKTHLKNLSLNEAMDEKSFMAGWKFHCILDSLRARYFRENNLYSLIPKSEYIIHASKIFEDILFYDSVDDWQTFIDYQDDILQEEIDFGFESSIVEKWHLSLQDYFSQKPNEGTIERLFKNVKYSQEVCDEINRVVKEMHSCEEFTKKVNDFHNEFESLLEDF